METKHRLFRRKSWTICSRFRYIWANFLPKIVTPFPHGVCNATSRCALKNTVCVRSIEHLSILYGECLLSMLFQSKWWNFWSNIYINHHLFDKLPLFYQISFTLRSLALVCVRFGNFTRWYDGLRDFSVTKQKNIRNSCMLCIHNKIEIRYGGDSSKKRAEKQ